VMVDDYRGVISKHSPPPSSSSSSSIDKKEAGDHAPDHPSAPDRL
jgi:hypothetical protein